MTEREYIDRVIKKVWIKELPKQYKDGHLLKEDSLKCLIYHYLRCNLQDEWLIRHRIRIYSEYLLTDNKRADIAIVKIHPKNERTDKHLSECVEEVIAIIELKYKVKNVIKDFFEDISKLKYYATILPKCQLYAGFISENYYNEDNCSWFDGRQTKNWANGCVSELLGYLDSHTKDFVIRVNSYNNLNLDLYKNSI